MFLEFMFYNIIVHLLTHDSCYKTDTPRPKIGNYSQKQKKFLS